VGQSRARDANHTWNTRAADPSDHGGRLVHAADTPSEEVGVALQRTQPKTFAALDDPYRTAERLERERDGHRAVLAGWPPDRSHKHVEAAAAVAAAERGVQAARDRVAHWQRESDATTGLGRLRPGAGRGHDKAEMFSRSTREGLEHAVERLERCRQQLNELDGQQQVRHDFDHSEGWRHHRLDDLAKQLDRHWADVVLVAARNGDPFAYGKQHLNKAHRILLDHSRLNPDDHTCGIKQFRSVDP
jgi:hypothetical protein